MTMTVKYVSPDRHETVVQCDRVIAKRLDKGDRHPFAVVVVEPNGRLEQYECGTVYVMNDAGATVSQWMITAP